MKRIQRHFSLSKNEARGLLGLWFVLMILSALGIYFRRPPNVSIIKGEMPIEVSSIDVVQENNEIYEDSTYLFDPNNVSWDELTQVGLRDRVASSWIAWRNSGKVFQSKEDIAAVYGISSQELEMVLPHILWDSDAEGRAVSIDENQETKMQLSNADDILRDDKVSRKVNLNHADQLSLEALPGIGHVLSERIIRYRQLLGGFYIIDQLLEVYGLKESHYVQAADHLYVSSEEINRIDLNIVSFRELLRHPYASYHLTKALFNFRTEGISIDSMQSSLEDSLQLPFLKLKPYLYDHGNEEVPVPISSRAR